MFFLDKTGLLSIVALFIQCGTAGIFGVFLAVLATRGGPWRRLWSHAFLALSGGLAALVLRFALAHHATAGDWVLEEGAPLVRVAYAAYMAGKLLFVWFVLAGVARARERAWPGGAWAWAVALGALAIGAAAPTIELLLLVQASCVPFAFAWAAHWLAAPVGRDAQLGERVVVYSLRLWAVLWLVYGTAVVVVGPFDPIRTSAWCHVLRLNSMVDLAVQVVLGVGLVVLLMSETQRQIVAALQERDELREQVRAAEKVRALSTLVSGVAHEINNPLTAIMGFASDLHDADPTTRARAARIVLEQAERCRGIVARMSLLGRTGATTATSTVFDVPALVRRVVDGFAPQCREADVAIDVVATGPLSPFAGDLVGLEQVLANLLSNALHVSRAGQRVVVELGDLASGALQIVVQDQGPGVPAADRARVFEPFWTTKDVGVGTGLGLAVVDAIVRAHGGSVVIADAVGGGARFTVELPRATVAAAGEPAPTAAVANAPAPSIRSVVGQPLHVLVVDDEPMVRSAIVRAAHSRGWRTSEAGSGASALVALTAPGADHDAVVCDLRMPGMSGIELHDALAARGAACLTRFVFITGDLASPESAMFAARCRAPFVTKPFRMQELLERVATVVAG